MTLIALAMAHLTRTALQMESRHFIPVEAVSYIAIFKEGFHMHLNTLCALGPRRIEGVAAFVTSSLPVDLGLNLRAGQRPICFAVISCVVVIASARTNLSTLCLIASRGEGPREQQSRKRSCAETREHPITRQMKRKVLITGAAQSVALA